MKLIGRKGSDVFGAIALSLSIIASILLIPAATTSNTLFYAIDIFCVFILTMFIVISMARKINKSIFSTKWSVAITGFLLVSVALLIPVIRQNQNIESKAATDPYAYCKSIGGCTCTYTYVRDQDYYALHIKSPSTGAILAKLNADSSGGEPYNLPADAKPFAGICKSGGATKTYGTCGSGYSGICAKRTGNEGTSCTVNGTSGTWIQGKGTSASPWGCPNIADANVWCCGKKNTTTNQGAVPVSAIATPKHSCIGVRSGVCAWKPSNAKPGDACKASNGTSGVWIEKNSSGGWVCPKDPGPVWCCGTK